ncbi:flagellar hook-associated protein 3 [Kordiimonas sediminis]|uniref:Flagellin n=1 Tax=Kordiimonas sediminis TaxID=1735581 RepID=A0A919ASP3_9PROT|nr:flagellin [Kordiimonas sediminis]GHF25033.1 flagellar hook-associated protein 3 [Kordiimonas sediminis]
MGRISSFGQQQTMVQSLMNNQERVFDGQRKIATGKKTDEYAGLGSDTGTVLGSRAFKSRIEAYQSTITKVRGKLDANDVQLGGMIDSVESLKDNILSALSSNQAEGFSEVLNQTFKFVVNSLNTNFDSGYLFGGVKTGTRPVNVSELADLSALPAISDGFDNGTLAFEARVADGVDLEFGILASDVATELFTIIKDLYDFDQGPSGPLQGEMDSTQFSFLQTELGNLTNAIDGMRQIQMNNGLIYERIDVVNEQHADTNVFLETFIAEIEDVDMAEVVTRLNNDQVALEASYQAVGSLSQLTLLRFL